MSFADSYKDIKTDWFSMTTLLSHSRVILSLHLDCIGAIAGTTIFSMLSWDLGFGWSFLGLLGSESDSRIISSFRNILLIWNTDYSFFCCVTKL